MKPAAVTGARRKLFKRDPIAKEHRYYDPNTGRYLTPHPMVSSDDLTWLVRVDERHIWPENSLRQVTKN